MNFKKRTIGDDNPHITAILQWNMNIAATFYFHSIPIAKIIFKIFFNFFFRKLTEFQLNFFFE